MNIAIIEDNIDMSELISKKLNKNGYLTKIFNSKNEFDLNFNKDFDLYIIDISLGKKNDDGFEIIKFLRDKKINSPIIIISGYNDKQKIIYGLDLGADDYITKPFSPEELKARIRTIIRREKKCSNSSIIKYNKLNYSLGEKILTIDGVIIKLTKKETLILELFLLNQGKLINKINFINYVWGNIDYTLITDNNINVILSTLRKKIGKYINIETKINNGYILEKKS